MTSTDKILNRKKPILLLLLLFLLQLAAAHAQIFKLGLVMDDKKDRRLDEEILDAASKAFVESRRFTMAERKNLDAVFSEKGLAGFIDAEDNSAGGFAELTGLEVIGLVSYSVEQSTLWIDVRLVDVRSGEIKGDIDSRRAGLVEPTTPYLAGKRLLENIREAFPPQGYVVRIKGEEILVDLGAKEGLKKGDILEIFREGETIFHPITGKPMAGEDVIVGELKVARASESLATCKKKGAVAAAEGDTVRLRPKDQTFAKVFSKIWKRD